LPDAALKFVMRSADKEDKPRGMKSSTRYEAKIGSA
jgi:hypothetical protein